VMSYESDAQFTTAGGSGDGVAWSVHNDACGDRSRRFSSALRTRSHLCRAAGNRVGCRRLARAARLLQAAAGVAGRPSHGGSISLLSEGWGEGS
jgi:hypothetical protein